MENIEISYLIEANNPSLDVLIEAQKKLDNAWEFWKKAEGIKVVQTILTDDNTPKLLKKLFEENNISRISWEKHSVNSDYMPDFAEKLFCWNEDMFIFTIVFDMRLSVDDALAFGLIESDDITKETFADDVDNFLLGDDFEDKITQEQADEVMAYLYSLFVTSKKVDARLQD
ncbi:hypothetical protein [Sulfurospirillum multivorans]|uniref:Uncharacterized protein n=2 Tax=Sulfurospirillum multivorans TaxID=66821 RepID=A0AA86DZQ5_SULMK|nr:hypothetical protein [Sulfurospirillum multivorans]AHJ13060.1 hypothetical protein SMUL_1805 [Sulfurospirillum multivorans DSM 12446]QEH06548.1 hypothetical protein SMN_1783 [Sulfurospirillum multivorans]